MSDNEEVFHEVHITYKSGKTLVMHTTDFKIATTRSGELSVTWGRSKRGTLRPMFINPDEIESVWQAIN